MHTKEQMNKKDSMVYWPLAEKVMENMNRLIQIDETYRTVLLNTCLSGTDICCADVHEFLKLAKELAKRGKLFNTWIDGVRKYRDIIDEFIEFDFDMGSVDPKEPMDERIP